MMLKSCIPEFYRVKKGQTVLSIAKAFVLPPSLLVSYNRLTKEVEEGQILRIPSVRGDLYTVQAGESKTLLSGSAENFERRNGTSLLYPGQTVFL